MERDYTSSVISGRFMKGCFLVAALILSVIFAYLPAQGAVYYVAKGGKDTNPGTEAKPWKTIGKASKTLVVTFQIASGFSVSPDNYTIDYNLIDGPTDIYGSNYVEGNPLFHDSTEGDFHLSAGSPAIDAGSPDDAPDDDYDGAPRPQGKGYDIGAFEFQGD
jgi:hypothetical protein